MSNDKKVGKTFRLSFCAFADTVTKVEEKHVASMVCEIESYMAEKIIADILDNPETRKYYGNGRFNNLISLRSAQLVPELEWYDLVNRNAT